MTLSRRQFTNMLTLGGIAAAMPFTMLGCGVFSDILAWTSVASVALDGIVSVLGPLLPPGGAAIIVLIKASLADLAGAISEYESDSNPADKATLLAKIRTFLTAIATNFQSFLAQLSGSSPILNVVLGLAQVLLAAIAGFLGQLPPPPAGAPAKFSLTVAVGTRSLPVTPKYYKTVGAFKSDWNDVCRANNHSELELK